MILTGDGYNRWFDKNFTFCVFHDASTGFNVEHSGLDAMVMMTLMEYKMIFEEYNEHGDVVNDPRHPPRKLPTVKRLTWDACGMEKAIQNANNDILQLIDDIQVYVVNAKYGKGLMKKFRLSPDGFIQMTLQLAYYKMYNKVVKTYEPSTGRLYLLGRTETINPVSALSVAWLKAMVNPAETWQSRQQLLQKSIKLQSQNRLIATLGQGCDRHLFALMCASMEKGMDMPKIFIDKAWQFPYVLSTSQTPIKVFEYGADLNYHSCSGGFAPNCPNGYGIAYGHFGDDILNISVTSWKSCDETDAYKFGQAIDEAMDDMKQLCSRY